MSSEDQLFFEAQDETSYYTWRLGRVELDPVADAITIQESRGGEFAVTLPVDEIASCEIVEREGISLLGYTLLGMLTGDRVGILLPLLLLLAPVAVIASIIAKRARIPAIKLTQSPGNGLETGWVIYLRSKRGGRHGRDATHEMAHRITVFLRQNVAGPARGSRPRSRHRHAPRKE